MSEMDSEIDINISTNEERHITSTSHHDTVVLTSKFQIMILLSAEAEARYFPSCENVMYQTSFV